MDKSKFHYARWYEENKHSIRKKKAATMKRLRAENPQKYRKHSRRASARLRHKIFSLYGIKCCLCEFEDRRALTLDHINNNGAEERKRLGEYGVYRRAVSEYRPDEYRILCMNCQFITREKVGNSNGQRMLFD